MIYLDHKELHAINRIMLSQGLPTKAVPQLCALLAHWEEHRGIKWVVERLKLMRSALLSNDSTGIKTNSDGTWKGPFKNLYRLANRSRHGAIRAHRILAIYGRWTAEKPTEVDFQNFSEGVSFIDFQYKGITFKTTKRDRSIAARCSRRSRFDKHLSTSDTKRVPFTKEVEADVLPSEHFRILLKHCPELTFTHSDFLSTYVYDIEDWDQVMLDLDEEGALEEYKPNDVVGRIACLTSDRGLKKRFIANPHRLLQLGTSRLQDAAARYLMTLPESLVYDQDLSVQWVKNQLVQGKKLYSLDLTSATDHFPKSPQIKLMRDLFPDLSQDIDLWEDICSSDWESPSGDTTINYGKGQPMGTCPSFAAFTVSHIHMVRSIGGNSSNFRIIGDDIVISDSDIAAKYVSAMDVMGVQISRSKSLFDDDKAEFAGRIIDKFGLWPAFKSAPLDIRKDPLGMVRQYGLAGLKLVPSKLREAIGFVARLPLIGPVHCTDSKSLDELDIELLVELYKDKPVLFESDSIRPSSSVFVKPLSIFEKQQLEAVGFRGVRGVGNNPRLVSHINESLMDGIDSPFLSSLKKELGLGAPLRGWQEEREVQPISYIKKVFRSRKKLDPMP